MKDNSLDHECTSWLLFPELTGGPMILHKNRDSGKKDIRLIKSDGDAKIKWLGLGDENPCMGFNEKGVACVMNSGETTPEFAPAEEGRLTTPEILVQILGNTKNAKEALKMLTAFIENGQYTHKERGSIFFIMDTKGGYIAELTAKRVMPVVVTGNMTIRANIWHNPGMAQFSRSGIKSTMNSQSREFQAAKGLNEALEKKGVIELEDIWRTSRMRGTMESVMTEHGLCNKTTNSAATIAIDKDFPNMLSTMYVAIGPVGHTMYIPAPICLKEIPQDIADRSWSKA
ncbi:MAG: hypothetical protein IKN52_15445, partial [Victivallales bacterium]|nr:hypothetical protein [Victivallales bacterium]